MNAPPSYDDAFKAWAEQVVAWWNIRHPDQEPFDLAKFDGCTFAPDYCRPCCLIHDLGCHFARLWADRREADATFRACIAALGKHEDRFAWAWQIRSWVWWGFVEARGALTHLTRYLRRQGTDMRRTLTIAALAAVLMLAGCTTPPYGISRISYREAGCELSAELAREASGLDIFSMPCGRKLNVKAQDIRAFEGQRIGAELQRQTIDAVKEAFLEGLRTGRSLSPLAPTLPPLTPDIDASLPDQLEAEEPSIDD